MWPGLWIRLFTQRRRSGVESGVLWLRGPGPILVKRSWTPVDTTSQSCGEAQTSQTLTGALMQIPQPPSEHIFATSRKQTVHLYNSLIVPYFHEPRDSWSHLITISSSQLQLSCCTLDAGGTLDGTTEISERCLFDPSSWEGEQMWLMRWLLLVDI